MELKRSRKEKMEGTLQSYNLDKINNEASGTGFFVYPENWLNVKQVLEGISKENYYEQK